jgi:tetratricopeptide (TPR) repeat protein
MKRIDSALAKFKEEMYLITQDINQAYYERAMNKIYELIVHHPDRAEPYYELGRISYNFWRNDEAETNYKKALEIDPEYFPTYTQYSLILIKEGRFDEADLILNRAKTIRNREDADIYFYFGMLYQHKGELDSAIQSYTNAINYSINEAQIDLNLKFIRACKELRGWE